MLDHDKAHAPALVGLLCTCRYTPGMNTTNDDVILSATFDEKTIIRYHWILLIPISLFIVTIPFVIIAAIVYKFVLERVVASWSATLTSRSLLVQKGVFTKIEKTIPLEKITDLSTTEGPIMRYVGLKRIAIETAGQSGAAGASLVSLLGIIDTDDFRSKVLAQRDLVTSRGVTIDTNQHDASAGSTDELREIAATLHRIEDVLGQLAEKK